MNIENAIQFCGGLGAFAEALHVDPPATSQRVQNWRKRGVPSDVCPAIERATGGRVRCEDLRPDIDWAVLRTPCDCKEAA